MKTTQDTTEYFIPPTEGEWKKMFALLREVAKLRGVHDQATKDQRMKGWLIEHGWIKESRKELDHFQVQEIIRRYDSFVNPKPKQKTCIE